MCWHDATDLATAHHRECIHNSMHVIYIYIYVYTVLRLLKHTYGRVVIGLNIMEYLDFGMSHPPRGGGGVPSVPCVCAISRRDPILSTTGRRQSWASGVCGSIRS